jgi:hypothetical protein
MKRFIITMLIATVLHAIACIISPPFEFGRNRTECFLFAFVGGLTAFPILFAIVLLPLNWGLRQLLPHATQRSQAIVAGLILQGMAAAWAFSHPILPHQHGRYVYWLFWIILGVAVTISFFWPFGTSGQSADFEAAV